ncbi:MAG: tRNA 2-thiouridine(34) synthase MnmA [Patescibacteria group bacterium]
MEGKSKRKVKSEQSRKVFVALSGGVDSSVAAFLLKEQGYEVTGVFMKCWSGDGPDAKVGVNCSTERDAEDARRVANHLNIPFYVFDFEKEYKKEVVKYMIDGYKKGITPNPDVMCNKEIKFGLFLKKALSLGADYISTGHYVRIAPRYISRGIGRSSAPAAEAVLRSRAARSFGDQAERRSESSRSKHTEELSIHSLLEAKDKNKDQSYFLWTLTQNQLKHCLFPIGNYLKPEVRVIAKKAGLPTADKKDSQGICFLGQVTLKDFLGDYLKSKKGVIVNTDGKEIGEHDGVYFYTIGQRHGLGLGGLPGQGGEPYYVAAKNVKTNTLTVARGSENLELFRKEVKLENLNFIGGEFYSGNVFARVRYRQPLARATLTNLETGIWNLVFDKPQKFVAAGQSAVFYLEENLSSPLVHSGRSSIELRLLGGGIINET